MSLFSSTQPAFTFGASIPLFNNTTKTTSDTNTFNLTPITNSITTTKSLFDLPPQTKNNETNDETNDDKNNTLLSKDSNEHKNFTFKLELDEKSIELKKLENELNEVFSNKPNCSKNEYLIIKDIESDLECLSCDKRYSIPKILPCGDTICIDCENKHFKNSPDSICPACNNKHEYQSNTNEFPINKSIDKLLKKAQLKLTNAHCLNNTLKKLTEIGEQCKLYREILNDSEPFIIDDSNSIILNIDIATESFIEEINKKRDNLIKQVKENEKHNIDISKEINIDFKLELHKFLIETKKKYHKWSDEINGSNEINIDELNLITCSINNILDEFKKIKNKFYTCVLGKNKLNFHKNLYKNIVETNLLGILSNTELPKIDFEKINSETAPIKIDYSKLTEGIEIPCIKLFDTTKGFFISIHNHQKFKLTTYSDDGILIDEKPIINYKNIFFIVKFNNYLIINYKKEKFERNHSRFVDIIRIEIFDEKLKSRFINIDYQPDQIFTSKNYIYVRKGSKYNVFDENLKLIKNFENSDFLEGRTRINDGRLFNIHNSEIKVFNNLTNIKLIKTIQIDSKYESNNYLFEPISAETFAFVDRLNRYFELFDFDMNCLVNFKISNIDYISYFSFTDSGKLMLIDENKQMIQIK